VRHLSAEFQHSQRESAHKISPRVGDQLAKECKFLADWTDGSDSRTIRLTGGRLEYFQAGREDCLVEV